MNRIYKSVKCLILCTICGLLMACSTDSFHKGKNGWQDIKANNR